MKKIVISALMILGVCLCVFGQQHTENRADQTLRSSGRVNPSTLGMEIDIPLGSYPGRGINVPISLSYSSKVWRMEYTETIEGEVMRHVCRSVYVPKYAENSASGWTSSLAVPYIEYTGRDNLFNTDGFPYNPSILVQPNCPQPADTQGVYIRRITVQLPGGETHELRADDTPVSYTPDEANCSPPTAPGCDINNPVLQANWNRTFYATDGSNIKYIEDSQTNTYTLQMPDGSFYTFANTTDWIGRTIRKAIRFTDRNGNYTSYDAPTGVWTDTLGRTLTAPIGLQAPAAPTTAENPQTYTLPGMTGSYKFHWKRLKGDTAAASGLTNFSQPLRYHGDKYGTGNFGNWQTRDPDVEPFLFGSQNFSFVLIRLDTLFNPVVLTEIELPTGQKYKFSYDIYGIIENIQYPTGGAEKFVYGLVQPLGYSEPSNVTDQTNRGVKNRKVYPTAGAENFYEWNYSDDFAAPAGQKISTDNPDRTRTERFLHRGSPGCPGGCDLGNFGYDNGLAGMAYEERAYSAPDSAQNRKLTGRKLTRWTKTSYPIVSHTGTDWHPRVDHEETFVYDENGNGVSATTKYEYEGDLNLRETPVLVNKSKQYAFVAIPSGSSGLPEEPPCQFPPCELPEPSPTPVPTPIPPTLLRTSETLFLQADENIAQAVKDAYKARNMIGLATASVVKDGNNNIVSKNEVFYDEQNQYYSMADFGTTVGYETPTGANAHLRGNPTTKRIWDKDGNTWITTHTQFDNFGNVRKVWDTSGDPSRFIETEYSSQSYYAYPTKIKAPAPDPTGVHGMNQGSEITRTFDFTTGLMLTATDADGQTATMEYDNLLRPTKVIPPAGGSVSEKIYNDTPNNLWVKVRQQIDEQNWAESTTFFDNLGRPFKTQTKDAQGDVFTEVKYDSIGRVEKTSNPYRQGEQILWSKPRYDELGRVVESFAPAPDGQTGASLGKVEFGISILPNLTGAYVTATDASGRKSRSISTIHGIARVDEATSIGGTDDSDLGTLANPNQPTFYSYNIKGELVKITQGNPAQTGQPIQNRYFMYDSLGRMIRVRQPEQTPNPNLATSGNPDNNQWTAGYHYDVFGNVVRMTDAKGVNIINEYDKAGRSISRCYTKPGIQTAATLCSQLGTDASSDTPQVDYYYDGKGLPQVPAFSRGALTKVTNTISEDYYTAFDNHGRVLASRQTTAGQNYDFAYKYNLSGGLVEQTYPSGRVVKNFTDADGGLASVSSKAANGLTKMLASGFDYDAAGAVKKMMLGNGLWETAQYNERFQLTQIGLGNTPTAKNLFKTDYEYGELSADGGSVEATKNTGFIARQTTTIPTLNYTQTYKYDALNRLTEAKEKAADNSENWKQTFGYDRFGNRTAFSQKTGNTQLQLNSVNHPTIDPATNRFTTGQGYEYDYNGNLTKDAEGRAFTFNGDDKQIEVRTAGAPPNAPPIGKYYYDASGVRIKKVTNAETVIFVYDGGGALAAEYSTQTPQPQNATTSYLTTDHLGSPRVITDKSGNVISRRDFMPFGEEIGAGVGNRTETQKYSSLGADKIRQRFTGYEKDEETGLDFAQARMYQNKHGRFTAVDPLLASASATNPQTFNRYIYTGNNPVNYTDPSGLKYYDKDGIIYWFDGDAPDSSYRDLTGQQITIGASGCVVGRQYNCASQGDKVRFDAGSMYLVSNADGSSPVEVGGDVAAAIIDIGSGGPGITENITSLTMTVIENNGKSLTDAAGISNQFDKHTEVGQYIGNVISLVQGIAEILGGLGTAGGGGLLTIVTAPACSTGVGCVIPGATASISATGLLVATHGLSVIGNTIYNMSANQGSGSRSGHEANVRISENGKTVSKSREVSGNMTPEEKAMGFPQGSLASHTEARAVSKNSLNSNQKMNITGTRDPCPSCKGKMNKASKASGAAIVYKWRKNGRTQIWEANKRK